MKKFKHLHIYLVATLFAGFTSSCTSDDDDNNPVVDNSDQIAYDAADPVVGSQLYNDFTKTPDWEGPSDANVNIDDVKNFKDFYRCKQCHAWDLKARFGSYIDRAPKVGRPDVSTVRLNNLELANISVVFDKVKNSGGAKVDPARTADGTDPSLGGNEHPDYGVIFTDSQIWDLVKFLREGAFDVDGLYATNTTGAYPTGSRTFTDIGRDGDVQLGNNYYSNNCATCHGADGTTIDLGGRSIGDFIREKPYEMQHKVVSGQLGTAMGPTPTTFEQIKGLYKAGTDTVAFPSI